MATAKKTTGAKKAAPRKSGNPKKNAAQSSRTTPPTPTPASQWKGKNERRPHPLTVPSGNTCLVRRVGMEAFLQGGVIPNGLMDIVVDAMDRAKARGAKRSSTPAVTKSEERKLMEEIQKDPQKVEQMFDLVDIVTCQVVVEPKVVPAKWSQADVAAGLCEAEDLGKVIPFSQRDDDLLYVDEVDQADKMFIFNYVVGGSADVERFRAESAERVAALGDG